MTTPIQEWSWSYDQLHTRVGGPLLAESSAFWNCLDVLSGERDTLQGLRCPQHSQTMQEGFIPMKLILGLVLLCVPMWAQENTFRLAVRGYQWTTTHKTLTFSWPGYSSTSCNGNVNMNGNI